MDYAILRKRFLVVLCEATFAQELDLVVQIGEVTHHARVGLHHLGVVVPHLLGLCLSYLSCFLSPCSEPLGSTVE